MESVSLKVVNLMSRYKWFNVALFDGHVIKFHPKKILGQILHHDLLFQGITYTPLCVSIRLDTHTFFFFF